MTGCAIDKRAYKAASKVTAALKPPKADLPSTMLPPYNSASSWVIGKPKPYPGALSSMR
jgi:hypothetical protein